MEYKIADISNFQAPANGDYAGWLKALKNKYGVSSVSILLSDGTSWHQPVAAYQAYHAYKIFGNFSAYHFFRGSGKAEAQNFLAALKAVGADKTTVVMVDAETRVSNLTGHINAFIDTMYDAGYHNIFVYSMESMFDGSDTGIKVSKLHHSPKIWVANISYKPRMKHDAWQYTWTGNVWGKDVDLDIDYTGLLAKGVQAAPKAEYWKDGKVFEVITDGVRVYQDVGLSKDKMTYNWYSKGSHFDVDRIEYAGSVPRLHNKYGYITANKKYVNKYK